MNQDVLDGMKLIMQWLDLKKGFIGVETNKPDAIANMKRLIEQNEIDDIEITLDDCINDSVIDDIRAADLNNMSPFEAMALLNELQKKLK